MKLGDYSTALAINQSGQRQCSDHADLERQYKEVQEQRFVALVWVGANIDQMFLSSHSKSGESSAIPENPAAVVKKEKSSEKVKEKSASGTQNAVVPPDKDSKPAAESTKPQPPKSKEKKKKATPTPTHTSTSASDQRGHKTPVTPFTNFEAIHCPIVAWDVSTEQLKQYCQEVRLQNLNPAMYIDHTSAWEDHEPVPKPPPQPTTDASSVKEPLESAQFDEIWCPILADTKDADSIILPTFHYLSDTRNQFW